MKRLLSVMLVLTLVISLFVGCGDSAKTDIADSASADSEQLADPTGDKPSGDYSAVCLLNGNLGDKSFFDSANDGMTLIEKELGIETKVVEMGFDNTKWEPALLEASEQDWDIIIVGTWQMQELLEDIAPQFPDKKYILFDSEVDYSTGEFKNIYSITYKQNHASYLAGVVAGGMAATGSNVIGAVAGMDIPVINDFLVGYIQGAKDTNPDIKVMSNYIGNFDDTAKAKEMALSQYNQNADIVFAAAAQASLGVIDAAKEKATYAIGVDADQSATFVGIDDEKAKAIITSVLKNIDVSLLRAIKMDMEGTLVFGQAESIGLPEGAVGIAKNEVYEATVPDEIKQKVEAAEKAITNGEIEVLSAFDMTTEEITALKDSVQ